MIAPGIDPIVTGLSPDELTARVRLWAERTVPAPWRDAARDGGSAAIRRIRSRSEYEAWYPIFASSGLVVPTWPIEHGGAGLTPSEARLVEAVLAPFNLGRLNPLGLSLAAPALYAHGTEEQRLRFLPPIVKNEEVWCQLFSEPGAGSDLASLATKAQRDGDQWVITGQKVWSTWAHLADFGVLLARTDAGVPKRKGITYFLIAIHQPGVEVRPLRHITGDVDFNAVFLDSARVPDSQRIGPVNEGWKVANATLSGERQMVSGSGSGGVDRIGGGRPERLVELARLATLEDRPYSWDNPVVRQELMRVLSEEWIRNWTNQRVRAGIRAGRTPGPESSVGKVHQGDLNQRIQVIAANLLGLGATAWPSVGGADGVDRGEGDLYSREMPYEVKGMLRSRANTIEGGTTEINKNIIAERVLGLPREPDLWQNAGWNDIPRN